MLPFVKVALGLVEKAGAEVLAQAAAWAARPSSSSNATAAGRINPSRPQRMAAGAASRLGRDGSDTTVRLRTIQAEAINKPSGAGIDSS